MLVPNIEGRIEDEADSLDKNIAEFSACQKKARDSYDRLRIFLIELKKANYESKHKAQLIAQAHKIMEIARRELERPVYLAGTLPNPKSEIETLGSSEIHLKTSRDSVNDGSDHSINEMISIVDDFGEQLKKEINNVGRSGKWGYNFDLKKASGSDYSASYTIRIIQGAPKAIRRKFLQLNGNTFFHPSYSSPEPWKIMAKFDNGNPPSSGYWARKPPYKRGGKYWEISIGGDDVWAISYKNLAKVIEEKGKENILIVLMKDLHQSFDYAGVIK